MLSQPHGSPDRSKLPVAASERVGRVGRVIDDSDPNRVGSEGLEPPTSTV